MGKIPLESQSRHSDRNSRILCAFHEEKLVASATLFFPAKDATDAIELRRVCVHSQYRRSDLLMGLYEHIARAFVLSDRKFIHVPHDDARLASYLHMGFRMSAPARVGGGTASRPAVLGKEAVLACKGMSTVAWLCLFGDLAEHLLEKGFVNAGPWRYWRIKARLRLKPLLKPFMAKWRGQFLKQFLTEASPNL